MDKIPIKGRLKPIEERNVPFEERVMKERVYSKNQYYLPQRTNIPNIIIFPLTNTLYRVDPTTGQFRNMDTSMSKKKRKKTAYAQRKLAKTV